ncbi:DNA helicase [Tanacetum coccineum]
MGKAASFASNKAQQVGQIISRKGTSNVASSLIGSLSTKKAPSCKDLMAHVFVQPKKTVVLVETDVVKVFDNTNAENISRPPAMPRTGRAQKQQCKDTYRQYADVNPYRSIYIKILLILLTPKGISKNLSDIRIITFILVNYFCAECEKVAKLSSRTQPQYNKCCHGGRVILPAPPDYPQYIKQLYRDPHFMKNIRAYNQMFSMTSLGANVDNSINNGKGPYDFPDISQLYHFDIGQCVQMKLSTQDSMQLYIYDTANEVKNRMAHFGGEHESGLKKEIVEGLIEFLDNHNALVQLFRTARDKYLESDIPNFKVKLYNVVGTRQYELPTPYIVGAIVFGGSALTENDFDLIVEEHSRYPQRVNKLHPCYMSLQFPLLFVYGEEGYHKGLKMADSPGVTTKGKGQMTMNVYYSYQLHERLNHYNLLPRGGKLFQQYVVTAYCAIEQNRLDYIRQNQSEIRNEYLSGLYDAIMRGDRDGSDLGTRLVLSGSFTGGPRYMYSHYLDALAICRVHGNPSFFITFTCNTNWPEIQEHIQAFPELTPADRADIVDRVFEKKVRDYIKFVRNQQIFGEITAVLYTIEFQKRGLPHCHSLLWLTESAKIHEDNDVNKYICAELPDPINDAEGYRVISELMVHGPCGYANPNASCMKDASNCNRNFPKPYSDKTFIDKDGYVHYRRRDTGFNTYRQNVCLDNRYIVPYNRTLCMRYYAHINVEYCGWTMLIKYLFKYISKGTDRVIMNVTKPVGDIASTSRAPNIQIDEIKNFVEARYIGPHEACWRIFDFPIHYRDPAVQILAVHLENMQQITFRSKDNLQSIINNPIKKKTALTEWLEYNKNYTDGHHLTYLNFPSQYTWYPTHKHWQRRQNLHKPCIGRLTYIHPSVGDLFYQRILLCHQKGCRSFLEIRTVNHMLYPTNKAACEALGLLGGDHEWKEALQEAATFATSSELRKLFVQILMFCEVSDPLSLWNTFWKDMSDDIPRRLAKTLHLPLIEKSEAKMKASVLFELEAMLNSNSKSLKHFGLPTPPEDMLKILQNRMLMEERNYNPEILAMEVD